MAVGPAESDAIACRQREATATRQWFHFSFYGLRMNNQQTKKSNHTITPSKSVHWIYFLLLGFTIRSTSSPIVISSNAAQPIFIYFTALRRVDEDTGKCQPWNGSGTHWSQPRRRHHRDNKNAAEHGAPLANAQAGTSLIANRSTTSTVLTPCARSQAPKEFDLFIFVA